ncbi:MAG: aryldialkylphosphatase [Pseudomonadota bacterium]
MTRGDLKGKAQTVLGPVDPGDLGPTLMHEHLIWDIRTPIQAADEDQGPEITQCSCWLVNYGRMKVPRKLVSRSPELAASEVRYMVDAGGRTIVELSSGGLRPDPAGLVAVSRETGAHVVMGCGHYVDAYQDEANRSRPVDDFAAEMVEQVFKGAWGTDIRAGIIGEIGCQSPWTDLEKTVMEGALIAQAETGAALNVHPGRHTDQPQEVMDFVAAHNGVPERTIMSHIDRTIFDQDRLFRLADTGCVIEFDLFGFETSYYALNPTIDMPNDAVRLRLIRALIDRGHLEQIVISHDICYLTRLRAYGGHGYGHIFENAIPLMRDRAFTEDEIDAIMVGNPRRLLTFV